jgi:hypothetical protein
VAAESNVGAGLFIIGKQVTASVQKTVKQQAARN